MQTLEIQGFRTFRRLWIPRLGRVNLIVGRNSVGKTTLLEALWLYSGGTRTEAIRELLVDRDELLPDSDPDSREPEVGIQSLFHGRRDRLENGTAIRIGTTATSADAVSIRLAYIERNPTSEPPSFSYDEIEPKDFPNAEGEVFPALVITRGAEQQYVIKRLRSWSRSLRRMPSVSSDFGPPFLRATSIGDETVGKWWDWVALRDAERRVVSCLNLIAPIDGIKLVENPRRTRHRMFQVKLRGESDLQPLRSLGDGLVRMFHVALGLEYARRFMDDRQHLLFTDGIVPPPLESVLLVDEVESGIHYSILREFWRFLFRIAKERQVQVFATTHSWDCIDQFYRAAAEDPGCDGMLIRLEQAPEETKVVLVDEQELAIATRLGIELR